MNNKSFDDRRIAEGYAKDRPYLHPEIIEMAKRDLKLDGKAANGLDVGCGAGLSTRALKEICLHVTGTDISPEMIRIAEQICSGKDFSFYPCKAEETADDRTYDIVTAAGVVNWVEQSAFLENLQRVMNAGGYLIVYDFWITDRMLDSEDYTEWWHEQYLRKFPKPFRKEVRWTNQEVGQFGFRIAEQKEIELSWEFDRESFIRFMMIQSNVNEQIERKGVSEEKARAWFEETLRGIFAEGTRTLLFEGYIWYIKRDV